ncbi:hypothetical protein [Mesorhizobium sp. BHbdii]
MRQRLLNGVLVGALAALFCLLAATAYTEVKQGRGRSQLRLRKPHPQSASDQVRNLRCNDVPHRRDEREQLRQRGGLRHRSKVVNRPRNRSGSKAGLRAGMHMQP